MSSLRRRVQEIRANRRPECRIPAGMLLPETEVETYAPIATNDDANLCDECRAPATTTASDDTCEPGESFPVCEFHAAVYNRLALIAA